MKYLKITLLVFVVLAISITHTLFGKYEKIWSSVDREIDAFNLKMENSKDIDSKIIDIKTKLDSINSKRVPTSKDSLDFIYNEKNFSN